MFPFDSLHLHHRLQKRKSACRQTCVQKGGRNAESMESFDKKAKTGKKEEDGQHHAAQTKARTTKAQKKEETRVAEKAADNPGTDREISQDAFDG